MRQIVFTYRDWIDGADGGAEDGKLEQWDVGKVHPLTSQQLNDVQRRSDGGNVEDCALCLSVSPLFKHFNLQLLQVLLLLLLLLLLDDAWLTCSYSFALAAAAVGNLALLIIDKNKWGKKAMAVASSSTTTTKLAKQIADLLLTITAYIKTGMMLR